jgi:hypothetical protein
VYLVCICEEREGLGFMVQGFKFRFLLRNVDVRISVYYPGLNPKPETRNH